MALAFILIGMVLIGGGILYIMFHYDKDQSSTVERAQNLSQKKYDPNMTRYAADKEAKASEARGSLLTNVNYEISQITETIKHEADALRAGYAKDHAFSDYSIEREKHLADHESYLALADNKTTVARIASQSGLDPETMRELILEEARTKRELLLEEARLDKEIRLEEIKFKALIATKTHDMEMEVEKLRRLKAIDLDFEQKMAMLDKSMAEIQHLLPEYLVNALHKQLADVNMEYEQVKELEEGEYKDRETKRVSMKMKALEKNIRERQKNFS